jgi:hypothetical protein
MWIRVQGKTWLGEKVVVSSIHEKYVSILNRAATPPGALRRVFEVVSNILSRK